MECRSQIHFGEPPVNWFYETLGNSPQNHFLWIQFICCWLIGCFDNFISDFGYGLWTFIGKLQIFLMLSCVQILMSTDYECIIRTQKTLWTFPLVSLWINEIHLILFHFIMNLASAGVCKLKWLYRVIAGGENISWVSEVATVPKIRKVVKIQCSVYDSSSLQSNIFFRSIWKSGNL